MWHEARRSEKKVHDMMDAARKRAQRRALFLAKRRGDPQQSIQILGSRCRTYRDDGLYQATQDQQGLIPWNGKEDNLIDRFDGRALLDFIRDPETHRFLTDEEGLDHVNQVMEAKFALPFALDSDDSGDERMEAIAKDFGVKRYGWLVYMDKKAKEEEKRQKEVIKGDPAIRKLSRKERRKASQLEREKEREAARVTGTRVLHHDPYRESRRSPTYDAYPRSRRSRSRSRSPSYSRRHSRGHSTDRHRSKSKAPKIEFITEFGGSPDRREPKLEGVSPPPSPPQAEVLNRSEHWTFYSSKIDLTVFLLQIISHLPGTQTSSVRILEALHVDPASGASLEKEKNAKVIKPPVSTSSALAKLKGATGAPSKQPQGEKKETPQERLKRIMSKQLNKQIKKDAAVEMAKKKEQEKQRLEKLAETSRLNRSRRRSRSRSYSRSPRR
uniref:Suppressor of white apricot N-terminal domain-containing protein n=1 Tax=Chenopodium quinoa TaxID=63459 RepID=A0A803KXX3_CHEQI